jgi:aspartyl-tRNA(Asn)/glutamyl-tRNA(Gln) amidotransferase subunit A
MIADEGPLTVHEAAAAMKAGTLTPVELVDQCLARIDRYESLVRAWVVVDRDGAREQAERLTGELKRGQNRGPLHGIPIGVKDIIDVFDLPTGCGSQLWANSVARQDAAVVKRLRQAGAVILGKTVTTAYAFLDPPVTRNPWDLARTPGGSSSGSAAAVACGMCLAALGTQTGGSLTRPAAFCGVGSLKPSTGRVGVEGVLPLAPTLDHVGVMANCVGDLAILLPVVAGLARRAPAPERARLPQFGRLRGLFDELAAPEVRSFMDRVQADLQAAGAVVEDVMPPPGFRELLPRHRQMMAVEAAAYHAERLRRHPDDYPPKIRELIEEGLAAPAIEYRQSLIHRNEMALEVDHSVASGLDAFLTPATVGPPPDRSTTGDASMNAPWSYTGNPTVGLPIGSADGGPPLSIQLVGHRYLDTALIAIAGWCEQTLGWKKMLPPVPVG